VLRDVDVRWPDVSLSRWQLARAAVRSGCVVVGQVSGQRQARWAHFACHAFAGPVSPSSSRLLLYDHQQALAVLDVIRQHLDGAELAFLSACSTARPSGRLTDEAIHLLSAFQLVGYQHVIGTLWQVSDRDAVDLAGELYTNLAATGTAAAVGIVLHRITRRLRNRWLRMPSVWASHIHSGPEAAPRVIPGIILLRLTDAAWTAGGNLQLDSGQRASRFRFLVRDRADQFTDRFDAVLSAAGDQGGEDPAAEPEGRPL
jgi:hypothetical protein